MEDLSTPDAAKAIFCAACFKKVNNEDAFCDACGYPLKGTEQEQDYFMSVRSSREIDLDDAYKKMRRAGNVLYWIAAGTLIIGFIGYATNKFDPSRSVLLTVNIILAAIYAGLGFWSRTKPLTSIISGAALYAIIFLLNAIANPLTIVSGIFFKIFFVGCFIKGVKSALEADKIKKELNIE
ncbi:hypothetical protein HDF24_13395 [Mucilaginibacter sp. X4EP1]|uniref:hypothetical protein n=1 Tax=Mucilaginibacter sp. X4EP1 TaxID=2723092 RepID=UPI0021682BDF|nr:hypothetical protein [Mucilaginibacter sp. X4EP1]MCS3813260.1 hypothetical protein [Mucilaginibacter sp. X4EP1]